MTIVPKNDINCTHKCKCFSFPANANIVPNKSSKTDAISTWMSQFCVYAARRFRKIPVLSAISRFATTAIVAAKQKEKLL